MGIVYLVPSWFYGYDIAFEIIFALVTAFVAWQAWKIYNISGQKEIRSFGTGFLLISLSYFIWALINLFITSQLREGTFELTIQNILLLSTLSIYAYIILLLTGFALITAMTLKIVDSKVSSLLLIISLLSVWFSSNKFVATYTLASIFVFFILIHYFAEYRKRKNKITEGVFVAFLLLFIGNLGFLFASSMYYPYVISHVLTLVAYIIIFVCLTVILKHGEKKKQA